MFSATGLPPGLRISPAGLISGVPADQSADTYLVRAQISDGKLKASAVFEWTVVDTSCRMNGGGHVSDAATEHHFSLNITERKSGADHGRVEFWIREADTAKKKGKETHRFDAATITDAVFSNDPRFKPGKQPQPTIDSVTFSGKGSWDGKPGYVFQAFATDEGEPGAGRDTFRIAIRDPLGAVVGSATGTLAGGNIQSLRLRH